MEQDEIRKRRIHVLSQQSVSVRRTAACRLTAMRLSANCVANAFGELMLILNDGQLRDELVHSNLDSPSALAERCKQLHRDIMAEEERAARETADLADQVACSLILYSLSM